MSSRDTKQTVTNRRIPKIDKNFDVSSIPTIYKCTNCGKAVVNPVGKFYKVISNPLYQKNDGYSSLCTTCVDNYFDRCRGKYEDEKLALLLTCAEVGWFFSEAIYLKMKERDPADIRLGEYIKQLNLSQNKKLAFSDFLITSLTKQKIMKNKIEENDFLEDKWTKDEKTSRKEVLQIVGYDPFEDYPASDRRYLFSELVKYFDDDISEDQFKLSQVIQIVNNNNQIRHYDVIIATLKPLTDSKDISILNNLKKDLVSANDKIAKENEISVKNRSNKDIGHSTLTYLMKNLREKDFDKAEADYYDQLKSRGTMWGIEMSMKAIQQNAFFDENDISEIKEIRRELVQELQTKVDDLIEEKRLLNIKIAELENKKNIGDSNDST